MYTVQGYGHVQQGINLKYTLLLLLLYTQKYCHFSINIHDTC